MVRECLLAKPKGNVPVHSQPTLACISSVMRTFDFWENCYRDLQIFFVLAEVFSKVQCIPYKERSALYDQLPTSKILVH